jgi:hypothetical protein
MDEHTRVLLLGAYRFIYGQQEEILQMQIVTSALRQTIRELGPDTEEIYGKHYLVASQSPGKKAADGVLDSIAQLIRQLSEQQKEN